MTEKELTFIVGQSPSIDYEDLMYLLRKVQVGYLKIGAESEDRKTITFICSPKFSLEDREKTIEIINKVKITCLFSDAN